MSTSPARIRGVRPEDRERILEVLIATGLFTDDEVQAAIDLVDEAIQNPARGEYVVHLLEERYPDGARIIHGYVCYGPTPRAEGVYDLYWIAVDPLRQGRGFGRRLLEFVERRVRRQQGRMLLIETSSKRSYEATVRFYLGNGYHEISRIKDFYRIENDKIVFGKTFA